MGGVVRVRVKSSPKQLHKEGIHYPCAVRSHYGLSVCPPIRLFIGLPSAVVVTPLQDKRCSSCCRDLSVCPVRPVGQKPLRAAEREGGARERERERYLSVPKEKERARESIREVERERQKNEREREREY